MSCSMDVEGPISQHPVWRIKNDYDYIYVYIYINMIYIYIGLRIQVANIMQLIEDVAANQVGVVPIIASV